MALQTNESGRLRWVVVLTAVGSFMAAMDTLVVASALSTIQRDLGASLADLEWTVNAYNLGFAVLLVPAAVLGDRLGRARTYAAGLALFALASAGCALAGSVGALIGAAGAAGRRRGRGHDAGPGPADVGIPAEGRGTAIGLFSAVTGIAVACGPGRWRGRRRPRLAVDLLAQRAGEGWWPRRSSCVMCPRCGSPAAGST